MLNKSRLLSILFVIAIPSQAMSSSPACLGGASPLLCLMGVPTYESMPLVQGGALLARVSLNIVNHVDHGESPDTLEAVELDGESYYLDFKLRYGLNDRDASLLLAGSIIRSMQPIKSMPMDFESDIETTSSDILLPDNLLPDKPGRRSDTYHFLAYQAVSITILYALPEGATGWTQEQKDEYSLSKWWYNVTHPQWDSDDFYINYLLHPYWGATYYVRSRERGFDQRSSFWYSAGMSAAYELGVEALFEEVSIQDLIVTPVGGWLVGEYFMDVRDRIEARHDGSSKMPFRDRFVLVMTDPLGELNHVVDGWFGIGKDLTIMPYQHPSSRSFEPGYASTESPGKVYGLTIQYRW